MLAKIKYSSNLCTSRRACPRVTYATQRVRLPSLCREKGMLSQQVE